MPRAPTWVCAWPVHCLACCRLLRMMWAAWCAVSRSSCRPSPRHAGGALSCSRSASPAVANTGQCVERQCSHLRGHCSRPAAQRGSDNRHHSSTYWAAIHTACEGAPRLGRLQPSKQHATQRSAPLPPPSSACFHPSSRPTPRHWTPRASYCRPPRFTRPPPQNVRLRRCTWLPAGAWRGSGAPPLSTWRAWTTQLVVLSATTTC